MRQPGLAVPGPDRRQRRHLSTQTVDVSAARKAVAAEASGRLAVAGIRAATAAHPGDPNPKELRSFGFSAQRETVFAAELMTSVHTEVELMMLLGGRMEYAVAGHVFETGPDRLLVFWGGLPHRCRWVTPPTEYVGVAVPLAWVLAWPLPNAFAQRLVQGELFDEQDASTERRSLDRALMTSWEADLAMRRSGVDEAVAAEVQSRLHRLALTHAAPTPQAVAPDPRSGAAGTTFTQAARFIADNYRSPITVSEIAAAAGVSARRLNKVFKESCNVLVWEYVVLLRVAHAKRLLATSDLNVLKVAVESGFGSQAQFYETFRRVCGTSPRRYREQHPHGRD